jgi:hypothetical protein
MKQGWTAAVVVAAAAMSGLIGAWALWPGTATVAASRTGQAQARQYLDASACLLTGSSGISPGTPGAQAWRAMESASSASHVMVSYLPGTSPADVPALLNTLVERKCGVIVVTGGSSNQVTSAARANPRHRFILVTTIAAAGPAALPPNAVIVSAADVAGRVNQEVTALAGAS